MNKNEQRDAAAQRLEDYIAAVLAMSPPLTEDQINRLIALLRKTGVAADA